MRRELLSQVAQLGSEQAENPLLRDVVWFSGIDVPRFDIWTGEEWILRLGFDRVRLDRFNAGAPLLKDHTFERSIDSQVGVIEAGSARIESGKGLAKVRFFDTPDAQAVLAKVDQGARNVSIEAAIDGLEELKRDSKKDPRVMMATGWEVEALAIVTVPADPNARIMLSASPISIDLGSFKISAGASSETTLTDRERFAARMLRSR